MPRPLKFTITKVNINGRRLYRIRIPARFSKDGKTASLYYKSREEARRDQLALQDKYLHGTMGLDLSLTPIQIRDIDKAFELIKESGISLSLADAVTIAIRHRKAMMQGISVTEFLRRYKTSVSDIRHWSSKQHDNWKFYATKFDEEFGTANIADINQHALQEWMVDRFKSASYFNSAMSVLGPAFTWAVKQELIERSPFSFIERRRIVKNDAIDVFSVEEAQHLLASCQDYRTDDNHPMSDQNGLVDYNYKLDCRDALVPFAFLLFAGIRPEEITKLKWEDVRLDDEFIHITPSVAKTNQVRHILLMDNLKQFIETIPAKNRQGNVIPTNWKRKSSIVRKAADLQNRHDTARHSFASYFLALHPNVDALRENLGHVRNSEMLFKHYRAAVSKKDAAQYFQITP